MLIEIKYLYPFHKNPFRITHDVDFFELMTSIEENGILEPIIVRQVSDSYYEILSGHRRVECCRLLGLPKIEACVKKLDEYESVLVCVDSNLKRTTIRPSERGFAYRIRLDAMKHQGKKDSSDQNGPRRTNEILASLVGKSTSQIKRFIRLTYLIKELRDLVDEGVMSVSVASEISFLNDEQQYELYVAMEYEQSYPSLSQATRMKTYSRENTLDYDRICSILNEIKPNQIEYLKIPKTDLSGYFPDSYTDKQKIELIQHLILSYFQQVNRSGG